jgi:hypothetical protein
MFDRRTVQEEQLKDPMILLCFLVVKESSRCGGGGRDYSDGWWAWIENL